MGGIGTRRTRRILFVAILLPLWASYLAKVFSWQLILNHSGLLNWSLARISVGPLSLIDSNTAVFIVFCYIWLPYLVIPLYPPLERIPPSIIEPSQDLGPPLSPPTR